MTEVFIVTAKLALKQSARNVNRSKIFGCLQLHSNYATALHCYFRYSTPTFNAVVDITAAEKCSIWELLQNIRENKSAYIA